MISRFVTLKRTWLTTLYGFKNDNDDDDGRNDNN